jgi:hypothetical protein
MKRFLLILTIIAVLIPGVALTGCIKVNLAEENGPLKTKAYDFSDFTGIDIGNAFELVVTPSENYSVSITAGEKIMEHITVEQKGTTLVFGIEGWTNVWFASWYASPKVKITMPVLNLLKVSGAATADVTGFKSAHDFNLELSGSSELNFDMETGDFNADVSGSSDISGKLTAADLYIELSGASSIDLRGSGGNILLKGSGASDIDLSAFSVKDADVRLSGATEASLEVNGRLDTDLSGASSFSYSGHPTLGNIETSGASDVEHIHQD